MAFHAQSDQVLLRIITAPAAKLLVMHFQVGSAPATLTSPTVATQHLFPKLLVQLGAKSHAVLSGQNPAHEAFSVASCRNACRWSPGRNLKNLDMDCRRIDGSSLSRRAPARKSAQIISQRVASRLVGSEHHRRRHRLLASLLFLRSRLQNPLPAWLQGVLGREFAQHRTGACVSSNFCS